MSDDLAESAGEQSLVDEWGANLIKYDTAGTLGLSAQDAKGPGDMMHRDVTTQSFSLLHSRLFTTSQYPTNNHQR